MYENFTDEEIVQLFCKGEKEIFKLLIDRYTSPIFNFSTKMVGANQATDIVQDIFIKVWKNIKNFDEKKSSFKTWIFTIAKNTTVDFLRKKRSYTFTDLDNEKNDFSDSIPDESLLPNEVLEKLEEKNTLTKALEELPPQWKTILVLHYQEDMTFDEISKLFKKPLNTIKSNHRRAILKLREILQ